MLLAASGVFLVQLKGGGGSPQGVNPDDTPDDKAQGDDENVEDQDGCDGDSPHDVKGDEAQPDDVCIACKPTMLHADSIGSLDFGEDITAGPHSVLGALRSEKMRTLAPPTQNDEMAPGTIPHNETRAAYLPMYILKWHCFSYYMDVPRTTGMYVTFFARFCSCSRQEESAVKVAAHFVISSTNDHGFKTKKLVAAHPKQW